MSSRRTGRAPKLSRVKARMIVHPLEERGFVTRQRDAADRRRHIVVVTDVGTKQLTKAARAQRDAEDVLFAALDDDQREQLRRLLLAPSAVHGRGARRRTGAARMLSFAHSRR